MNLKHSHITATDLRDYAKSLGWKLLPDAVKDKMFIMSNPKYDNRQLVFPLEATAPDYYDSIEIIITKLSNFEKKSVELIVSEIQEIKDDTLKFRIFDSRNEESFIPLSYAVSAINGTRELFVAAACTVLKPQIHHPRMNRSEALDLIDRSKFRHTERGSFILKVSSPINALDIQANIFGDDSMPFVRQTTLTINKALNELVASVETDTVDILIDEVKNSPMPLISSNFCKALTNFQEEHQDFDLSVGFKWASAFNNPTQLYIPANIKVQKEYFTRIDEVRRELRNIETQREDVFMATVERLDGDLDNMTGVRYGEVLLNLLQEDEIIRARTHLNPKQYSIADKAHMTAGAYVRIKGKLHPGNQPRLISEVSLFELFLP
jgi:hypothetical protein